MKCVRIREFGGPELLAVEEAPTPRPGVGELLVRVSAASVNPSDTKNIRGLMHQTKLPRTPGRDFAGTVDAGNPRWVGREVWGTGGDLGFTRDGTHATHVVIPEAAAVERPATLSARAASCCRVTFVTAAYGLGEAGLAAGQTIAVIGVFGGVGRAVAQIAKLNSATVIGIARSDAPADLPAAMADIHCVNSSHQEPVETVRNLTRGTGADIVFDTVGGSILQTGLKLLAPRGRLIEITAGKDPNVILNIRDFYHQQARLIGVDSLALSAVECGAILTDLSNGFESGALAPPPVAATYPLERAKEAYEAVESGKGEGRHVLVLD